MYPSFGMSEWTISSLLELKLLPMDWWLPFLNSSSALSSGSNTTSLTLYLKTPFESPMVSNYPCKRMWSLFLRCLNILKREMKEALINNSCQKSVYKEVYFACWGVATTKFDRSCLIHFMASFYVNYVTCSQEQQGGLLIFCFPWFKSKIKILMQLNGKNIFFITFFRFLSMLIIFPKEQQRVI